MYISDINIIDSNITILSANVIFLMKYSLNNSCQMAVVYIFTCVNLHLENSQYSPSVITFNLFNILL